VAGEERSDAKADAAMDRYASGEQAAFSDLYDLIAPRLHGYLMLKTRNRERTEDLLQHTFANIHEARGRFQRGARVMPWAVSIARRLFIDGQRRGKYESVFTNDHAELLATLVASELPPDQQLDSKRLGREIHEALALLPPRQREAFELVRLSGLSQAEAAEVLGTTIAAVKLRMHRAGEGLRVILHERAAARQP
jgi:RNA polymerase sigma-70 factor (ECF subfamily)